MKVRVQLTLEGHSFDEVINADSPDTLMLAIRDRVAKEIGWKGLLLRTMTPLQFSQEAVRRYNEAHVKNEPQPQSVEDFVKFGERTGYLTVLD